jgi:hypothetical protein
MIRIYQTNNLKFLSLIKQNNEYMIEDQTIVGTNNTYFTSKSQTVICNIVTESLN